MKGKKLLNIVSIEKISVEGNSTVQFEFLANKEYLCQTGKTLDPYIENVNCVRYELPIKEIRYNGEPFFFVIKNDDKDDMEILFNAYENEKLYLEKCINWKDEEITKLKKKLKDIESKWWYKLFNRGKKCMK